MPAPNPPTSLVLTPGLNSIAASWTPPAAGPTPTGYAVKIGAGAEVDIGNVTSHDFTGLTPSTLYAIEVRAYVDTATLGSLLTPTSPAASTEIVPGGEAALAFNSLTTPNQSWVTTSGNSVPSWLRFALAAPAAIHSYEVTGEASFMNRAPLTWTWEGANSTSGPWTVLDTVASAPWSGALPLTCVSDTAGVFTYYRMNITAIVTAGPYCSVSELRVWGVGTPTRDYSTVLSGSSTTLSPPDPPTGLSQTGATTTSVTVGWTAPVAGADPESYEMRVDGGTPFDLGLVTSHTVTGLLPDTTYTIEVRTVGGP